MAKEYSQVNFRIPTKLKDQIEQSAIENDRSITAELVARLEASFSTSPNKNELKEELIKLAQRLEKLENQHKED